MPDAVERSAAEGPPLLAVSGVHKQWEPTAPPVLAGVELALGPGVAVAVAGANGAGKTTLLRIVAGVLAPDAGSVHVAGVALDEDRPQYQRGLGFLSAGNSGLYARLKAEHHLELWTRLALMPRKLRAPAIARAIDAFGLAPLCGRRVDRLSMGERQRLRLALAFVHQPRLALLDEPGTSLDADGAAVLDGALAELKARGGSALVCVPTGWTQPLTLDRRYLLAGGHLEAA
jgi:ABC-type multidrug transport system ATPase subunit